MAELLSKQLRGLLMIRDELAGWLGSFDKYSSGGKGGDVPKWLEMFGGRPLVIDRKGTGTTYIPSAAVSLTGRIQPAAATAYDHAIDAITEVLSDNYPGELSGLSWILHPRDWEVLAKIKDSTNQPIRTPDSVAQLKRFITTSLPVDEGAGGAESVSILGDFSQVLLGMRTSGIRFVITDAGLPSTS